MNNKDTIAAVIRTLNQISVCGKDNLDMLLGSIIVLEGLMKDDPAEKEAAENGESDG